MQSIAEIALGDYSEQHKNKNELKKRLTKLAQKIKDDTKHPLVFIVDELDRCRPTFSIEFLERVKHLFDIPNIVFIFGIDRMQLGSSIKAVYGDIDVEGYLHRFFDMDFSLPPVELHFYCENLLNRHNLEQYVQSRSEDAKNTAILRGYAGFNDYFYLFSDYFDLSLREIEHSVRVFIFVCKGIDDGQNMYPQLLTYLILLRIKNQEIYKKYIKGELPTIQLLDFIYDNYFKKPINKKDMGYLIQMASLFCYIEYRESKNFTRFWGQLERTSNGGKTEDYEVFCKWMHKMTQEEAKRFIALYRHFTETEYNFPKTNLLPYLSDQIELATFGIKII